MRQDTKVLLDRLGAETFRYYDFESPSADTDIWPMFEALLLDERVVGRAVRHAPPELSQLEPEDVAPRPAPQRSRPVSPRAPGTENAPPGMFGRYDAEPVSEEVGESVRDMLARLAPTSR